MQCTYVYTELLYINKITVIYITKNFGLINKYKIFLIQKIKKKYTQIIYIPNT